MTLCNVLYLGCEEKKNFDPTSALGDKKKKKDYACFSACYIMIIIEIKKLHRGQEVHKHT